MSYLFMAQARGRYTAAVGPELGLDAPPKMYRRLPLPVDGRWR